MFPAPQYINKQKNNSIYQSVFSPTAPCAKEQGVGE
jgi:hypothetical protein